MAATFATTTFEPMKTLYENLMSTQIYELLWDGKIISRFLRQTGIISHLLFKNLGPFWDIIILLSHQLYQTKTDAPKGARLFIENSKVRIISPDSQGI
jgi:hypothetical protein